MMATLVEELAVGAADPRWADAGVTLRRQDYWTRLGYLRVVDGAEPCPGSGYLRRWPVGEIAVAARMVRLTAAGLSLEVAARVARKCCGPVEIGPDIVIEVTA